MLLVVNGMNKYTGVTAKSKEEMDEVVLFIISEIASYKNKLKKWSDKN